MYMVFNSKLFKINRPEKGLHDLYSGEDELDEHRLSLRWDLILCLLDINMPHNFQTTPVHFELSFRMPNVK